MVPKVANPKDVAAGALYVVVGVGFAVGALAYRKTRSIRKALGVTTLAFLVGIVGATAYLIATWPTGG